MWTTSSSRAEPLALAALLLAGCVTPHPEAPAPALAEAPRGKLQEPIGQAPVELVSVRVTPLDPEDELWRNEPALKDAREPLLIEVQTAAPLDHSPTNSYPLIVWNDKKLHRTRLVPKTHDRLQAYLLDRREVLEVNTVHVQWEGRENLTRTREPLRVRAEDVGR